MAKDKEQTPREAFTRADPSKHYIPRGKLYVAQHKDEVGRASFESEGALSGAGLFDHIEQIRAELKDTGSKSLLDYGAGRACLYRQRPLDLPSGESAPSLEDYWGLSGLACYDPFFERLAALPSDRFDAVVCTGVLQHCAEEDLDWILAEIFDYARRFVFLTVACHPAGNLGGGAVPLHATVKPPDWWRAKIFAAAAGRSGLVYRAVYTVEQQGRQVIERDREVSLIAGIGDR